MSAEPEIVLQAVGLSKSFGRFAAVTSVDLAIAKGRIHALIGPNGAGKTTLFNLLTCFLVPTAGRIMLRGRDITRTPPAQVARLGLVRSFQISATFPKLSVLDNVRIPLQRVRGGTYDFWRSDRALDDLDGRARQLLEDVGLGSFAERQASDLPYGRKRALEIATTLALNPEILLLDEPMAGLGQEDIIRISELIRRVAKGRTVLMVEHNLSVVETLCDRIMVLARGQVLAEGDYAQVSRDPKVQEAYIGSDHAG